MHYLVLLALCVHSTATKKPQPATQSLQLVAPSKTEPKPADDPTPDLVAPVTVIHKTKRTVVDRYNDGLLLSIGVGGGFAGSGPLRLGGSARFSVGYIRPEHADHLGVTFDPSLQFAWNPQANVIGAQISTEGLFAALPILASGNFVAGPGLFRVLVGPSFDYVQLKTNIAAATRADDGWFFGLEAGLQYLFALPIGLLGLDARFDYAPYTFVATKSDGILFSIGASYAFTH